MRLPNWLQFITNRLTPQRVERPGGNFARAAGMMVTIDSALGQSIVMACVRVLQNAIAPLEWQSIREDLKGAKTIVKGTPVNWILNKQANPEMTAFSWRETALMHALLTGNHYSEIERDAMGRPIWLWPIDPERVHPDRDPAGKLIYQVWQANGGQVTIPAANMFHLHGMAWDGLVGMSVIAHGRRAIGASLAMDEYGGNFYANGTHVGLVFEHPGKLSDVAHANLKKSLKEERSGPGNAFRHIITEEGIKLTKVGMSMVDAQFDASRRYGAADIARLFGVPLHMLAELDRSTNNNIEQQSIEFVRDGVAPWCRRLEQEADVKLFGIASQRNTCTRLNVDTLQQGTMLDRYTSFEKGRNGGWLCVDDVRAVLGMNALPEGKGQIFLQPMNYIEAGEEVETKPSAEPIPATVPATEPAKPATVKPDNVIRREALAWWNDVGRDASEKQLQVRQ